MQIPLLDTRELIDETVQGDEWSSPEKVFKPAEARFGPFGLDAAAAPWSAKCARFFSIKEDALSVEDWGIASGGLPIWLNPPYSRGMLIKWMPHVVRQAQVFGRTVVCLVPVKSSERWWAESVFPCVDGGSLISVRASPIEKLGWCTLYEWEFLEVGIILIKGRLKHTHETGMSETSRFPSALVVYRPRAA